MIEAAIEMASSISRTIAGNGTDGLYGVNQKAQVMGVKFLDSNGSGQLTDAIKALLKHEKVYGYSYEGKRHDAGDKLGFLKATVEFALRREDLGPKFREWLRGQTF